LDWLEGNAGSASPDFGIGVYISGDFRGCPTQPNLTAQWVSDVTADGWAVLPIDVGPQVSCGNFNTEIPSNPALAYELGAQEAANAVLAAAKLGIGSGVPIVSDLEGWTSGPIDTCTMEAEFYLQGWTDDLHAAGDLAGVYGSSFGTHLHEIWRGPSTTSVAGPGNIGPPPPDTPSQVHPDFVWAAEWPGSATVWNLMYMPNSDWGSFDRRSRQFNANVSHTYGGVTMTVDDDCANGPFARNNPADLETGEGGIGNTDAISETDDPSEDPYC